MPIHERQPSDVEQMFRQFQETRFYKWLDRIIAGPYRWLILPVTGVVDAFLVVIPTELIVVLYMMRNQRAVWWYQTLIVSVFAGLGYGLLAFLVSMFGVDAVAWLSLLTGSEMAINLDQSLQDHVVLFAISAGVTSFFPMPATAFAIATGLFGAPIGGLMLGTALGKSVRFGAFAYGTRRWGNQAAAFYFRHANFISIVLIILIVLYLVIQ